MRKSDSLVYYLSTKMIIILFLYYLALLLSGIACVGIVLIRTIDAVDKKYVIILSFTASVVMSVLLCSVQYIRRLYKACLTERIVYLCVVLSGYMVFSVGKYLDKFEKISEEIVTSANKLS